MRLGCKVGAWGSTFKLVLALGHSVERLYAILASAAASPIVRDGSSLTSFTMCLDECTKGRMSRPV